MYAVKFTSEGLADVKALPKDARNFLRKQILGRLAQEPHRCSKELRHPLEGWRSFHCGNYRIVFRVYDDLQAIAVAAVGRRLPQSPSDVYKRLEALAAQGRLAESVLKVLREFSGPPRPQ